MSSHHDHTFFRSSRAPATLLATIVTALFTGTAPSQDGAPAARTRAVDVAICLDTSGSMDGLIDAARQKLWGVVNDLATAKPTPRLRVALLTFGNDGHPADKGWVRLDTPFTSDLDLVSQSLFALTTNGGNEYVGRVLQAALEQLQWSSEKEALKMVFVAGNESAEQDTAVDFRAMCRRAIERGILVNSIYCGNPADATAPSWREVATLADGQFAAIDKDQGTVAIATPFDAKLAALGAELNRTYIPFGRAGRDGAANQWAQDENAANTGAPAAAQRAACKASTLYTCSWDLIDAYRNGTVVLTDLKTEDLPEAMRGMTPAERVAHVAATAKRRAVLQQEIATLNGKREQHVAAEMKKQALDPSKGFDHAVRTAVRSQAQAKGFRYEDAAATPDGGGSAGGNE